MKRLVLIGAGHAHARVVLELGRFKRKDVDVVVVSPQPDAPYSGMVPGWIAGHYRWEECCIDFARLCRYADATLILDTVHGIDAARSQVVLASGQRLDYDLLSLNVGSTLHPPTADGLRTLPMRPLGDLQERWHSLLDEIHKLPNGAIYRLLMIGGGAAGVESLLAAHHRLTTLSPHIHLELTLATHGTELLAGQSRAAASMLQAHLQERGIRVYYEFSVAGMEAGKVTNEGGQVLEADAVLWATGAQAHAWPKASGLAVDHKGFVRVDATLRSVSHPAIFAAGDCVSWTHPLPKAGVFAVRMGPVLTRNLLAALDGGRLESFQPQRRHLALIGTGARHAVASWGWLGWQGEWIWRWKERIDRRFIATYTPQ